MKYAVLTTKHVAGHCLWPSRCTDYTVANSTNKTDVVEAFCKACAKRGVLPGFYYCSWDNHHRFGSKTRSDGGPYDGSSSFPKVPVDPAELPAFTTSLYQSFQTAQITELLTQFGPIAETWIDIPGVLGRGYRTFLYNHIARLQPQTVIMMNNGVSDGGQYDVAYAWPSDLIAMERNVPPATGHRTWRQIEGKNYYMPGEVCDPIGKEWFGAVGDRPRPDDVLSKQFEACRAAGVNLLLDVPPDRHGLIPDEAVTALMRLRKNAENLSEESLPWACSRRPESLLRRKREKKIRSRTRADEEDAAPRGTRSRADQRFLLGQLHPTLADRTRPAGGRQSVLLLRPRLDRHGAEHGPLDPPLRDAQGNVRERSWSRRATAR